jgi:hypothetical protein
MVIAKVRGLVVRHLGKAGSAAHGAPQQGFVFLSWHPANTGHVQGDRGAAHRCEALGAVHLLAHQFLAFKINAAGARSDLVYSEPPSLELLERSSAALVLTEWKVAADAKVAQKRFTEARKQAELYRQGPLAAVELTSYRYAIVVTKKQVPIPHDELAFDVIPAP